MNALILVTFAKVSRFRSFQLIVLFFVIEKIHWGSAGLASQCEEPRIAIGYACSDDTFEIPYFPRSHLPLPELR